MATPAAAVNLQFVQSFGTFGFGSGQFRNPRGVAVDGSGNVYVANTLNNRIVQLSAVTAVPEPSEIVGTLLAAGSVVAMRRRLRHQQQNEL